MFVKNQKNDKGMFGDQSLLWEMIFSNQVLPWGGTQMEPKGGRKAPFKSILSATHGYWLGMKGCLRRAHTSIRCHWLHSTPAPVWTTQGKNKQHESLCAVQSCSSLSSTSTRPMCASAHPPASALPTLQCINAFPCSSWPVSESLPPTKPKAPPLPWSLECL